ncbi:MAG: hypothetical protein JOZ58_14565 [Acetobacteraceae bacterium]|nr:hypothetical protein [Acetobacteraceae bacterium]
MTPSAAIVSAASGMQSVTDAEGRILVLRRLNALDKLRLFKAAGPVLAQNQPWLGMAMLACSVAMIDEVPIPPPTNEQHIEALVSRLGDSGIAAAAAALATDTAPSRAELVAAAGN